MSHSVLFYNSITSREDRGGGVALQLVGRLKLNIANQVVNRKQILNPECILPDLGDS